jgi:hypothetical protein
VTTFTAVYDACVLYPSALRSLLMHLALTDLFRARWTDQILDEVEQHVLASFPDISQEKFAHIRRLMNQHVMDALVTGYDLLIPGMTLPDPDDRHVLAAAIVAGAGAIVTYNLKDFPVDVLAPHGIEAQHPDDFITHLLDLDAAAVCAAVQRHRASMKNPPKTVEEYLDTLLRMQLPKTVAALREFGELI